jgi:hypothetical protein
VPGEVGKRHGSGDVEGLQREVFEDRLADAGFRDRAGPVLGGPYGVDGGIQDQDRGSFGLNDGIVPLDRIAARWRNWVIKNRRWGSGWARQTVGRARAGLWEAAKAPELKPLGGNLNPGSAWFSNHAGPCALLSRQSEE